MTREEINQGHFVRGTHPDKSQTGRDKITKVLIKFLDEQTGNGSIYNFCQNGRACAIHGHLDEIHPPGNLGEKDLSFVKSFLDFHPFFGIEFGDILPKSFLKKCSMSLENWKPSDMTPIFIGKCGYVNSYATQNGLPNYVHIVFIKTDGNDQGYYMPHANLTEDEFISILTDEEQKKMTVHYINNEGVKTKEAVNSMDEITDLKEFLYKFDN